MQIKNERTRSHRQIEATPLNPKIRRGIIRRNDR